MSATRWRPNRLGLLNLYRYDDEVFRFAGGRLLLRGNNGTGKTRVLALTLPFLLDGATTPARVEPDGDSSRRFEWHLLLDRHHERTGYCWIEFLRRDETGAERRCTLGCGMRALEGHQGLRNRWFFVTDQAVGPEFPLKRGDGTPWTREECKQALDGRGTLYDQAEAYRHAVDDHLFQLGEHRYRSLIDLLIELRRPQLSRKLDEARLAQALADALPPVEARILDDVADNFRSLERDRDELRAAEDTRAAVTDFARVYHGYLAVQARRLADAVRAAQVRYDEAQGAVRAAVAAVAEAQRRLDALAARRQANEQAQAQAQGEERALRDSDAMRSAERLDRLREDAQAAAGRALADAQAQADAEAAAQRQRQRAGRAVETATQTAASCQQAGTEARRQAAALGVADALPDASLPATAAWDRAQAAVETLRRAMGALRAAERVCERAAHERELAGRAVVQAEAVRDRVQAQAEAADLAAAQAASAHRSAVATHLAGLRQCQVEASPLLEALAAWCDEPQGADPVATALAQAGETALAVVADAEGACRQRRTLVQAERAALAAEAEALRAGRDPEPERPIWRSPADPARRGAPLWACCDFAPSVDETRRAGLEAALQASQLLDAWIEADGSLRQAVSGEVLLRAEGPVCATALAEVLVPTPTAGSDLTAAGIAAVLSRIGLGRGQGATWVDGEGAWAVGPLHGAWSKPAAQHLGAASRAAARAARLRELAAEIARCDGELAELIQTFADLAARRRAIDGERRSPGDGERVRETRRERRAAHRALASAREALSGAQAAALAAQQGLEQARQAEQATAADCGLTSWLGRLEELAQAVHDLHAALAAWRHAAHLAAQAQVQAQEAVSEVQAAEARLAQATTRRQDSAAGATALAQELATLEATAGVAVADLLRRLDAVRRERERLRHDERQCEREQGEAREERGRGDGARVQAETRLQVEQQERSVALDRLRTVAGAGLLSGLGGAWATPIAADLSDTQVVELARALARDLADTACDERAADRVGTRMGEANQRLQTALSAHDHRPVIEEWHGIWSVRVPFMGRDCDLAELGRRLDDDIAQRRQLLTTREREVIETFLIDEACDHLHQLLHEAGEWVAGVNRELSERPMSTGLALRFRWDVAEDAPAGAAEACARLVRPLHAWSAADRAELAMFLQRCIAAAREALPGGSWQEQLGQALDYRRWHRFSVERQQDQRWQRLTRRTHGTGSGGEKAIALTVPQFAAAAAHYRAAPLAPRLILLDEAFVGIDADMRRKCMGLLAAFDLDVVLTSEREWGCYDTVPELAIYQLATEAGSDCVATTRYVWNGRERRRDEGG